MTKAHRSKEFWLPWLGWLAIVSMAIDLALLDGGKLLFAFAFLTATWFGVAWALLSRPPGIPRIRTTTDWEDPIQYSRQDLWSRLPVELRWKWSSLATAALSCLVWWTFRQTLAA